MALNPIRHITVDAHDPMRLGAFWALVTGYVADAESDAEEVLLEAPAAGQPGLLFVAVADDKTAKNRVHLDIQPPSGTRDEFVERMLTAGATIHEDHRKPDGLG